jgi:hypothetical protein
VSLFLSRHEGLTKSVGRPRQVQRHHPAYRRIPGRNCSNTGSGTAGCERKVQAATNFKPGAILLLYDNFIATTSQFSFSLVLSEILYY